MADSKISALTAQTSLASTDMLVIANSGSTTKKITVANFLTQMPGYEIGYDAITAPVTVSATVEASSDTVISCAAHTFDGAAVMVEFFATRVETGTSAGFVLVSLWEGGTELGIIGITQLDPASGTSSTPFIGKYRFTPSAASHTYTVKAYRITSNATISADVAGTAKVVSAYVRFTKV